MPATIGRVYGPELTNDELYLLHLPQFLGLRSENYDPDSLETFLPHTRDSEDDKAFSLYDTATSTILWRRDPKNKSKLQSNARIIRWSDGSLTLQHGANPKEQYKISTAAVRQDFNAQNPLEKREIDQYRPDKDQHMYLGAPHLESSLVQLIQPINGTMRIVSTEDQNKGAVAQLEKSLAAAAAQTHDVFGQLRKMKEDPELERKRAELADKEISRRNRKVQLAEEKAEERRKNKLGGRMPFTSRGAGGLSEGFLEGDDDMPSARRPTKKKKPRSNRRGEILTSSEDDGYPRGRNREDEYDREDDFLAASDEEGDVEADDDDPDVDDLDIEGRDTVVANKTRGGREGTPKRSAQDDDIDEGGGAASPQARKKRRVIDSDEDDD